MKLSHLSLAVVSAIALAACGTSNTNSVDNGTGKTPPTPPVDRGDLNGANANGLKGGALPVSLSDVDLSSTSTTGADNYIRGKDSKFDKEANSQDTNNASATAIATEDPKDNLSNYVAAQQPKDDKFVVSYFGSSSADDHNYGSISPVSLQSENAKNVKLVTAALNDASKWNSLTASDFAKSGLVAANFVDTSDKVQPIVGSEKDSTSTTRILGHLSLGTTDGTQNSYAGVNVDAKTGVITPEAQKLDFVQFGRVTGDASRINEDTLPEDLKYDKGDDANLALYHRDYMNHNDPASVSFYFYRGNSASSNADVQKAISTAAQAGAGEIRYQGTALTYGLSNTEKTGGSKVPNSVGSAAHNEVIVGSFVDAVINTADQSLKGAIYNSKIVKNGDNDYVNDPKSRINLVKFDGELAGNTFQGNAYNAKNEKGRLTASLFGPNASELGGAVTSVSTGYAKAGWGAVFGAQRVSVPVVGGDNHFFVEGSGKITPKK